MERANFVSALAKKHKVLDVSNFDKIKLKGKVEPFSRFKEIASKFEEHGYRRERYFFFYGRKSYGLNRKMKLKYPKFVSYLISHGDSVSTAERRERRIRTLSSNGLNVEEPDIGQIYEYIESRIRSGIKKKSVRLEIKDLEHWFIFRGTPIENDVLPALKKEPDPDPFIPSPEEVKRMRNFCMARKDQYTWKRNLVMIDLLAATVIRAGELLRMNQENVKKNGTIYVKSVNGEEDPYVPPADKSSAEVIEYIKKFRYDSDKKALFTTRTGRYNYTKLREIVKYIDRKTGVEDVHPHSFRHYFATTLVRLGEDIRRVQILVGHARIDTTTRYTHLTQTEVGGRSKREHREALPVQSAIVQNGFSTRGGRP